ncbi:hypothetical protein RHS01_07299 [Rhizoctonia solani]|uniref:Uncharacterized protein n=1 Tax=Rhizoctonia solani TaxID=456999 RepID=A0A8H7I869_9AGAM|nr:hypothetical protein RHS01_07299 [Rhizoctonia solani]
MVLSNVSTQVFEGSIDPYDPEYHWGGVSIYPEGPIPTQVEYPGLPAGATLPPVFQFTSTISSHPLLHISLIHHSNVLAPKAGQKAHQIKRSGGYRTFQPYSSYLIDLTSSLSHSDLVRDQSIIVGSTDSIVAYLLPVRHSYMRTNVWKVDAGIIFRKPSPNGTEPQGTSSKPRYSFGRGLRTRSGVVELRVSHPRYDSSTNRPTGDEKR